MRNQESACVTITVTVAQSVGQLAGKQEKPFWLAQLIGTQIDHQFG